MAPPNALEHLFLGHRGRTPDTGARLGEFIVTKVITAGGHTSVCFRADGSQQEYTQPAPCPMWNDAAALGAPNTHTHTMSGPAVGDRCLIAFVGAGVDRPWCLSWSPT